MNILRMTATLGLFLSFGGFCSVSLAQSAPNDPMLICKAKRSAFHYDWSAASLQNEQIDQNSVRYKFKAADRPAGERGENLKVGECGWASTALANNKKEKSEFLMKSLSEEATEAFYKIRTGKVFMLPVRKAKSGLVVSPKSEVSIVR